MTRCKTTALPVLPVLMLLGALVLAILVPGSALGQGRTYATGFESVSDFAGFYIVPRDARPTASHDQSREVVRSGTYSHKGWINGANPPSTRSINNNHRGYPTVQLYKLAGGAFRTPVQIELWVWLDVDLKPGEWFSFATLDHTRRDSWDPVLVNLNDRGFVELMHVPVNGQGRRDFQTSSIAFPMRRWVQLKIELHFSRQNGYAKVWQDGQLVSEAPVRKGNGLLTQAHFGLYAPPSMTTGVVYNDDLTIRELAAD